MNSQSFFPFPIFAQQPGPQPLADDVPARVRLALEFLQHLTLKTMTKGMVNEVGFDTVPGQELTLEEASAQATACNLLRSYLRGRLRPSRAESLELLLMKEQAEGPGVLLNCFACSPNPPQPSCPFCKGSGEVLVHPKNQPGG